MEFLAFHSVRQERDRITKQRDDLQNLRSYESEIDRLSIYFDEGNNRIFNARVTNDVEYGEWIANWKRWDAEASDYLERNFGLREKNLFKNLVIIEPLGISGSYDNDVQHNHDRCMVAKQLESLRGTIVRHSERAEKWRVRSQSIIASIKACEL